MCETDVLQHGIILYHTGDRNSAELRYPEVRRRHRSVCCVTCVGIVLFHWRTAYYSAIFYSRVCACAKRTCAKRTAGLALPPAARDGVSALRQDHSVGLTPPAFHACGSASPFRACCCKSLEYSCLLQTAVGRVTTSLLHITAKDNNLEAVQWLVSHGLHPKWFDCIDQAHKVTPLGFAFSNATFR